jgi:hypothetical protein
MTMKEFAVQQAQYTKVKQYEVVSLAHTGKSGFL